MLKYNPEFYESIREAAQRRELWEVNSEHIQLYQLELEFNSCTSI